MAHQPNPPAAHKPVPDLASLGFFKAEGTMLNSFHQEVAGLLSRGSLTFPGAQPVSFARKHLQSLRAEDYYVCEKSDGVRCLLYFTADGNNEIHYLIDRKNDYYFVQGLHVPLPAPPSIAEEGKKPPPPQYDWNTFHTDTLLDGELVYDIEPSTGKPLLKYLVFDCLLMDAQPLVNRTLDKRLGYFMEKVHVPYRAFCAAYPQDAERFPFALEKKGFEFGYGIEKMFREVLPNLKHGSDGLIFTCRVSGYVSGTDEKILKWKRREENSVDFKLELEFPPLEDSSAGEESDASVDGSEGEKEKPDYDAHPNFILNVFAGKHDYRRLSSIPSLAASGLPDTMHATPSEWETMKAHAISRNDGLDGAVVECHIDSLNRWRFLRFRDDKTEANHVSVVEKVVESIEDAVAQEELLSAARGIREEWKRREEVERKRKEAEEKERRRRYEAQKRAVEEAQRRKEMEAAKVSAAAGAGGEGEKRMDEEMKALEEEANRAGGTPTDIGSGPG